jgi:hypothetical protein
MEDVLEQVVRKVEREREREALRRGREGEVKGVKG